MTETRYRAVEQYGGWFSIEPMPSVEALREFYAGVYFQNPQSTSYATTYDPLELKYRALRCRLLLKALAQQGNESSGTLLDVGAGEGFLMAEAAASGLTVLGIDFSEAGIQRCHPQLRSQLMVGGVEESLATLAHQNTRVTVCTALNVIEHVIDPISTVKAMREVLAPGGIMALTVPNDFSDLQKHLVASGQVSHEYWLAPPQHLHYFNTHSIQAFCRHAGLVVVDAYADFPIELFLLHPASNYVDAPAAGAAAHKARITAELLMAETGLENLLALNRSLFKVGIGRALTVLCRTAGD